MPIGLIDQDPKHIAWLDGYTDREEKMHFWLYFYCPLCCVSPKGETTMVYFSHEYFEDVGDDWSRSAICRECDHAFVVPPADIL